MSADTIVAKPTVGAAAVEDEPTTPHDDAAPNTVASALESQQSMPSTDPPASPRDTDTARDPAESINAERSNARQRPQTTAASLVIPSSLTPPPSTQVPSNNATSRAAATAQRLRMLSPPVTGHHAVRPDATPAGLYAAPRPERVLAAAPDELRLMIQSCLAEQSRLKMEAAHHKLQYQLLSVRADEDAHRAAVEQELILCQLDALQRQRPEAPAPPKRLPSYEPEISKRMYSELRDVSEKALKDNARLRKDFDEANKRLKAAKKLIVRQEEQTVNLRDENDLLRTRLLDKRELWDKLASPGGMFHTPKTAHASPAQFRQTPRQTPKHRGDRQAQPFDVLVQAATQENHSTPSTPITPNRTAGGRHPLKHHRNVQSLSSLPSTPNYSSRPRGSDLLPPPDLVPQTEPTRRFVNRDMQFVRDTPDRAALSFTREDPDDRRRRHSRESTISAEDNELLARAALQSVAQAARSLGSAAPPPPRPRVPLPSHRSRADDDSQTIYESQASQAASAMLRRDPRESFEVAASAQNSRDVTPTPEKRLQSTLRGPVNKLGLTGKRKLDATEYREEVRREPISPTKRLRLEGGLREGNPGLGLGIRD